MVNTHLITTSDSLEENWEIIVFVLTVLIILRG